MPRERALGSDRRVRRSGRRREHDEEGVPLRAYLDTTTCIDGFPDQTSVRVQELRKPIARLPEQPSRALDVGEQERHRPCGRVRHG